MYKTFIERRWILLPTLLSMFVAPVTHAVQCPTELKRIGNVVGVDVLLGEVTQESTGLSITFGTDTATQFKGNLDSLADLAPGDFAEIRYCPTFPIQIAVRITDLANPIPPGIKVIDLSAAPGMEGAPVTLGLGDDAGEGFGGAAAAVAIGDVNGDGFDDLVVGASSRDQAGAAGGSVDVIFGGAGIAGAEIDLDTDGVISSNGETRILPSEGSQLMGAAVATGDFDADGYDDVLIGSPGAFGKGQAHVVFGGPAIAATVHTLDVNLAGPNEMIIKGQGLQENTGFAVASGDINADGFDDMIIGAPGREPFTAHIGGTVFIVYGGPAIRGLTLDMNTNDAISAAGETRIFGPGAGQAGVSIASADINGDGFDDVALGTFGEVFVVYGSSTLPASSVDLAIAAVPTPAPTRLSSFFGHRLGISIATGDVNGDGYADVIAGADGVGGPGDNFPVGEVVVLYGSSTLPGAVLSMLSPPGSFGETRVTGREEFSEFAKSVAAGDVNGDGFDDLIMGAPGSVPPGFVPETPGVFDGSVYVLHGSATLPGQQFIDIREFTNARVLASKPGDALGTATSSGGDLDRDGLEDFAVSSLLGDNPSISAGENGSGTVDVIHGDTILAAVTRLGASRAGDGIGGTVVPPLHFGPVIRAEIDFSDNDVSTAGFSTATITHSAVALGLTPAAALVDVYWSMSTNRVAGGSTDLTFQYTDAELNGLDESTLFVFQADTAAGPFVLLPTVRDVERNEVTATTDHLSVFALADAVQVVPEPNWLPMIGLGVLCLVTLSQRHRSRVGKGQTE